MVVIVAAAGGAREPAAAAAELARRVLSKRRAAKSLGLRYTAQKPVEEMNSDKVLFYQLQRDEVIIHRAPGSVCVCVCMCINAKQRCNAFPNEDSHSADKMKRTSKQCHKYSKTTVPTFLMVAGFRSVGYHGM